MTLQTLSAAAIGAMIFTPVRFVVPGLLPEGLTLFAGKPKAGKSFAILDVAIAVASGGLALGSVHCPQADVLVLALEDGTRRLQDRMRKLLPGQDLPARLYFAMTAPRLNDGLVDELEKWLEQHPETRLIVIDTFVHIKPASTGRGTLYDEDALGLRPLHLFAKSHPGLAIVVIHHTRKQEAEDPFDTISGSHGLTGMADTLIVLARQGDICSLTGQGRDMEPYDKAIERDRQTGGWRVLGDFADRAATGERQAILTILQNAGGEPMTTKDIAASVGKQGSNVSHLLKRLVTEGLAAKVGHGKWKATRIQPVQTVQYDDVMDDVDIDDIEQFERTESLFDVRLMPDAPCSEGLSYA
ncbi:AAA family ATPase [Sandarakinorhabdus limnophila]|uniref:AAA family ATPase n=1 Tax=Sandarakinorhabdus limnophila TaxID=210512 RepID=UPI0026E93AEB|nr:AAA family ATPase [Sandarakinorhabdus limnophila]MCM0032768.1 AAA family ATPase [Sandarakinorhabdus limnophila]